MALQQNNLSPMGFGQPYKRVQEAVLRPPQAEGYGMPARPMPANATQSPAPPPVHSTQHEPLRGVPTGLYSQRQQPQTFPANATYDRLQQSILQGIPSPPPPAAPAPQPAPAPAMTTASQATDPNELADAMAWMQSQLGGGF